MRRFGKIGQNPVMTTVRLRQLACSHCKFPAGLFFRKAGIVDFMKKGREKLSRRWFRLALVAGCFLGLALSAGYLPMAPAEAVGESSRRPLPEIDREVHGPTRTALFAYG
jgi:hypothetical protein